MHPHALLRMSLVVTVAFIVGFSLAGCGKQQKAAPAKMPQVSKEPSAAAADTADIFKEFYSEDSTKKKAGGKSKKAAQQETFSPSSSSSVQTEFSAKGRYTVQITCVRSKSFADGMSGKMKDKGYPAYVAEVQNPTPNLSGTFYRVRIGGFNALSAAKSFGENTLVPAGYQYWVDKKSNDNVGMEGYGLGSGSAGSNAATSYDNAPSAAPASSYQPAPATTPAASSSSYESPNSTYSSPSSSSSSSSNANSATSSGTSTTSSASPSSTSSSPAASSTASSTPSSTPAAASSAPASTPSATGSTTGKVSTGSSTESGWGTDSASKSGW